MVDTVTAFRTTDGTLFEGEKEAKTHQANLDLRKALSDFCDEHAYSGMTSCDVFNLLVDNADALKKIFNKS